MIYCDCCTAAAQMYSLGGSAGGTIVATADKTDMSAETTAAVTTANLSQARYQLAAAANPSVAGYYGGGRTTTNTASEQTTMDKLTFATDTTANVGSGALSLARAQLTGLSERSTKCYFAGGLSAIGGVRLATTDVLTFSGDSTSAVGTANLSQARSATGGLSEGTTKGYWAGGATAGVSQQVKTGDKITFSTDTTAAQGSSDLSAARFRLEAGSDGSTKGYWGGGQTGGPLNTLDKITFSTDTTAAITTTSFSEDSGASGSDGTKLLGMGGSQGNGGYKATFATDVGSILGAGAQLSSSRTILAGSTTSAL